MRAAINKKKRKELNVLLEVNVKEVCRKKKVKRNT
jgi:hypothetical protein